jgi:sialic acid synthase SpsE
MSVIRLRNGREIGDYLKPYIVAELNTSHFGDIEIARDMIRKAKAAGCDCVKFQSWSADTLYCEEYYKGNAIAKRIVKKFALSDEQLQDLSIYAATRGIDFASTPYSIKEAEFLVEQCNVPFVKIASMDLNNTPYLIGLGKLGVPLVLSTGMGTLEEIAEAVKAIEATGNEQIVILHCTSVYPADPEIIRLQNIIGLRSEFPAYPIGYSDHSHGIEIPVASVALGACLIEKHFTLDSSRIGMDNQMATEPEEMEGMIKACYRVHASMGGTGRTLGELEKGQVQKMRRSLIASRFLEAGHVLTEADLGAKRPGTGIPPNQISQVLGKRLTQNVDKEAILTWQAIDASSK